MKRNNSLAKNTVWNFSARAFRLMFPFLTYPYVARVLGPDGMGRYDFANSLTGYFLLAAGLGIPIYAVRTCAGCRDDREALCDSAAELLAFNIISGALSAAALAAAVIFVPQMTNDRALFMIFGSKIFFDCFAMEWLFKAVERYKYLAVVESVSLLLPLALVFLAVRSEGDVALYAAVSMLSPAAKCICDLVVIKYGLRLPVADRLIKGASPGNCRVFLKNVLSHFRPVMAFFAMSCAVVIYQHMDNVMLGFIKGTGEVGIYTPGVRVKTALCVFSSVLYTTAMPRSVYYWSTGAKDKLFEIYGKLMHIVIIVQMPTALFLCLFSRQCIGVLSGPGYQDSIIPARILCLTVIPIGISVIIGGQMLIPMKKEKVLLYSELAGAAVNLILNTALIPRFGAVGAAAATLAAETAVTVCTAAYLGRYFRTAIFPAGKFFGMLCCFVPAAAAAFAVNLRFSGVSAFGSLIAAAAVFFTIYFLALFVAGDRVVREAVEHAWNKIWKIDNTKKKNMNEK